RGGRTAGSAGDAATRLGTRGLVARRDGLRRLAAAHGPGPRRGQGRGPARRRSRLRAGAGRAIGIAPLNEYGVAISSHGAEVGVEHGSDAVITSATEPSVPIGRWLPRGTRRMRITGLALALVFLACTGRAATAGLPPARANVIECFELPKDERSLVLLP